MTHATHIAILAALTIGVLANATAVGAVAQRTGVSGAADPVSEHAESPGFGQDRGRAAVLRDDDERARVSLDQAVAKVRSRVDGKVIRAETRNDDGRPVHHIKVLDSNGRVRTLRVDGRTGRIL